MKRKLLKFLLIGCFLISAIPFSGCAKDKGTLSLYAPDGAPLIAATKFFENPKIIEGYNIDAVLTTGAAISPLITSKTPDIAIAPMPVCAKSYADTNGEYVFFGTAVFGLNHIVTNLNTVPQSLTDLVGEIIYSFQKNGTPSLTLKAVLSLYSIPYKEFSDDDKTVATDKVNIEYLPSPAEVRNYMIMHSNAESYRYGLLAEPIVGAEVSAGTLKYAFDLQQLFKDKSGSSYPQAGIIIRKSLLDDKALSDKLIEVFEANSNYIFENAAIVAAFLKDTLDSAELPNKTQLAAFIESEKGKEALRFESAKGKKDDINSYLSAIGVTMPDDMFYFS